MLNIQNKVAAAIIVAVAASGAVPAASAETLLRLSTYVNEADIRYEGFKKFAELAESKTQGRVRVQIFPSAQLHGWGEGVDAVQGGISDISWIPADTRAPCYSHVYLYPTAVDLENQVAMDAEWTDLIRPELAKINLTPLFSSNYSYDQEWWFEERIESLGDLSGKLVRSIGPLVSEMIETYGGKPVFVSPKEVFQSAERGVVDGINMGVATYSSWKLWSVMPHMVNADLFYGNLSYAVNKEKFDALSAADQRALTDAGRESEEWLKPRYEQWVNERVGLAVMQGGAAAASISDEERDDLISRVQPNWDKKVDAACGADLANKFRDLFRRNAP